MKCKKCGYENKETAKYCGKCGAKIEAVDRQRTETARDKEGRTQKKTKRNKNIPVILCISLLIIAGIGAALFGIGKVKEKQYREYVAKAERYIEELDYESAEEACLKAIELEDSNAELYLMQGDINRKLHKDSVSSYEKALELNPNLAEAYVGIMHVKADAQEFDEVEEMLSELSELPVAEDDTLKKYAENFENYHRYTAYGEKALRTELNRGMFSQSSNASEEVWVQSFGLCFGKLVDFDGNGTNELVICTTEANYESGALPNQITDYVLEVWGYENGEIKQLFSGTPLMSGVSDRVVLACKGDKWYLCTGNTGGEMDMSYYTYENGEFIPEITLEANIADLSRKINGEEADQTKWDETVGQFEQEEYLLQGYDAVDINSRIYDMAFWECISTENEVNYREKACYRAITESEEFVEGENPGVDYGEYTYQGEDAEVYVSSYRYNFVEAETKLDISIYNNGEYARTAAFVWNEENQAYEATDTSNGFLLTYKQEGEKLFIELTEKGEVLVNAELQRDTQYDC